MIYPDPEGQIYVNGQAVGPAGDILCEQGDLMIPAGREADIRQALRPVILPAFPTAQRPSVSSVSGRSSTITQIAPARGRVVIDPGHGGKDPGTRSAAGVTEKSVVLDIGVKVDQQLSRAGVDAEMTRSDDTFVDLDERNTHANRIKADLFISIHANSCPRASKRGFTIYVVGGAGQRTMAAARAIERNLMQAGFPSLGIQVHEKHLRVLERASTPALLLEVGYLSNSAEASILADAGQRSVYAQAVSEGIAEYLHAR
jgi:N-acetylmuramoyl-L-alanine amidase